MTEALINTLLGMGTVFVSLILISFIISLLKPLSDLILGVNKNTKKEVIAEVTSNDSVIEVYEEVDMDKESELVAVITAAIMASMNVSLDDGLVVRSIRRKK
jgi:Na+-transporting methylmalonyl-CoA/oxaloacetate decarboxylase gamma subunit